MFVFMKSTLHSEEMLDQLSTVSFFNKTLLEFSRALLSDETSSKLSEEVVLETLPPEAWSILKLIKDTQELDPQCRWIVSWFYVCFQIDILLALELWFMLQLYFVNRENLLIFINYVFVSAQEALCSQLLEIYHDCSSDDHWEQNKTLNLICHYFTWSGIVKDVKEYMTICLICQEKIIH